MQLYVSNQKFNCLQDDSEMSTSGYAGDTCEECLLILSPTTVS